MIKKLSKLTMIMLLLGTLLVGSAVACQSQVEGEDGEYGDWSVNWNDYRPVVKPPQETDPQPPVDETPDDNEGGTTVTPPSELTPAIKPATYTAMIKSATNSLNVRSAPSTSGQILGTLDKGDMVRYEGKQNGWYKTVYKEKTAYIYAGNNYASVVYMKQGSKAVENIIAVGEELLGYPYVWGSQRYHWGNGTINTSFIPGQFDCSALMQYMFYKGAGVLMALNTRTQVLQGEEVALADMQRGDVMFFTNESRYNNTGVERVGHVALYLGDNYILHTASDHAVIEEISAKRWSYFIVAKRFI
ncbi:MAG: C40 family peptidase [Clostridia bacterium]|nr:C40 family peptidase [Clostridia bacterium]